MASVDENNNDITTTRRSGTIKKSLIVLLSLGFLGSVAAIGVVASGTGTGTGGSNNYQLEKEWAPFLLKPSDLQIQKLRQIRELSPFPAPNGGELRADVCYTLECLDAALILLQSINFTVNPCDDFFDFSCGRWLAENPRPSTASRWSQFNILRVEVNNITQKILESPPEATDFKPVQQVKEFYGLCVDEAKLETVGVAPVVSRLDALGKWPAITDNWAATGFDLVKSLADIRRIYQDSIIIRPYVSQDIKNTTRSLIYLDQPGFFLSRSVLLDNSAAAQTRKDAYKAYFVGVATALAKETGATVTPAALATQADEVIAFETSLAQISAKDEDRTNTTRVYNLRAIGDWQTESGAGAASLQPHAKVNWKSYLDQVFSTSGVALAANENVIVLEIDYLKNVILRLNATTPKVVANYALWRVAAGLLPETTAAMRTLAFEFDRVNSGLVEPTTRKSSCAGTSLNGFGMAIGVPYIKEAFNLDAKANVDQMVVNLRGAFKELLETNDWMDNSTKALSAGKLDAINSFMAFPEWLNNQTRLEQEFEGLDLVPGEYLQSVISLSQWMGDQSLKTLRDITNKDYWLTYPGVVNAFYSPEFNSITFPAGILQPPFYRSKGPESINYGGIGVVIGHEVTHGFDDQGSQYDANGNAQEWWTPEIRAKFLERAQCIVDQYGAFNTTQGSVNGDLTSGENIADNGGVRQSYRAYQNWIKNNNGGQEELRLPGLEVYTPDQLFFLGYANIWCESISDTGLANQLATDPHSPAHFRVLGPLRNSEIFSEKWNCPVGSGMNPPVADKCILW